MSRLPRGGERSARILDGGIVLTQMQAQVLMQQAQSQSAVLEKGRGGPPTLLAKKEREQSNIGDEEVLAEYPAEPEDERPKSARRAVAQYQNQAAQVDQGARTRQRVAPVVAPAAPAAPRPVGAGAPPPPPPPSSAAPVQAPPLNIDEVLVSDAIRKALEREARQARLVRSAVVLGEKEYCVLIDPDGKREIKVGPARVFPGPYDTFMITGSRERVYNAYELLPQRALWLRVISPISREEMARKMPRGVELDREQYFPGGELLLTGVSGFFFPFNEIEILSPQTGEAVVGNDHSNVFIEAIGIDQKSGIYVRDLTTGEVRLVRGKQSYLVDPRKEIHITRTLSRDDWNLWIMPGEPHKATHIPVTTPWAISIVVPHNTAVLATSAAAQRVIEGPCVALLEYEETLVPLRLSTGTPKDDEDPLVTCYLRTVGNRVSDVLELETADFVRIHVRITSSVTFQREHREKWFNSENYVQQLCDHLRSIVRSRARTMSLSVLWPQISAVVRDTILGPRNEAEGGRKGRFFAENGMMVHEVEVLEAEIQDAVIAEMMRSVQRESVTLTIGDRQAQEALSSVKLRTELERQKLELAALGKEREAKLKELERKLGHEARLSELREREAALREQLELSTGREQVEQRARLERDKASQTAQTEALLREAGAKAQAAGLLHAEEIEHLGRVRQLELALLDAQARAVVAERGAVQPQLVEALTALGDKALLGEVAHNMNLISLFRGKEAGEILKEVVGGTRFAPALSEALSAKKPAEPTPPAKK